MRMHPCSINLPRLKERRLVNAPANVALRDDELARIRQHLGREPTAVEVHAFDAQWSEHCSYKSSRHHLKKLPGHGPAVVLGPGEDAGALHLGVHGGKRYAVVVAHESHNHPSQVVPFEGAATGIGGIVRDVLCMGAEVIAVADPLRLGRVDDPNSHQRAVAVGVVDGIGAYGNAIGVPNIAGDVYFDERFDDNCLVNVVALGVVEEAALIHSLAPPGAEGWDIVLVGKATDASGFGGASFSSVVLDNEDEDANKGAVQVPDPFLKNVLMRATYRVFGLLRESKATAAFKDLGAGGVMGCSAEIVGAGGYGADINLDEVNVAIEGLPPEVIAVGETQERLLWVLPPKVTPEVLRIYNEEFTLPQIAYNARATIIGRVTAEKKYVLRHRGRIVMDVDVDFLTGPIRDELPYRALNSHLRSNDATVPKPSSAELAALLPRVVAHRDVCSREPLFRRYDAVVRGMTVVPRGCGAGVVAAVRGARLGVALAVAGNPRYGRLDPRRAAELAVVEAVCKVAATGARPLGLTDCLNFGNPRKLEQYSDFVAAVDGLGAAARELALPFVSGNVSLYNESATGSAVPASAIVSCIGALDDVGATVTPGLKCAGSPVFAIGNSGSHAGGTVYADLLGIDDELPQVDYAELRAALELVRAAVDVGAIRSCTAVGGGGTLAAVARATFTARAAGRRLGIHLSGDSTFDETPGFVVEVADAERFLALGRGGHVRRIGTVSSEPSLRLDGESLTVEQLYAAWSTPLAAVFP
jgi:phosphoribosylformylglycinamidine synthase subunit PurL